MSVDRLDGLEAGRRAAAARDSKAAQKAGGASFADALSAQIGTTDLGPLKLSSHAQQRIQRREIDYDEPVAARLEAAVNQAAAKGSRDSLVLVDSTAFVVSVRNRTVITAVPVSPRNDQVFTNVDSAVIG
jgi:flagellar operon protein